MASLNHPKNLKYSESDEWVRVEGDEAVIGISDYAQDQLGDIVYIEMPLDSGQEIAAGGKFGDIESVKATSELVSPLSGSVVRVNEGLKENPELVNDQPYEDGWMFVLKLTNPSELDGLMDADRYLQYIEGR